MLSFYWRHGELVNTGTALFTPVAGSVCMQVTVVLFGFVVDVILATYLLSAPNVVRSTAVPPAMDAELD